MLHLLGVINKLLFFIDRIVKI